MTLPRKKGPTESKKSGYPLKKENGMKKRFTEEHIIEILKEVDFEIALAKVCRKKCRKSVVKTKQNL